LRLLRTCAIYFIGIALLQLNLNILSAQTKTTSLLWGENGELWDTRGRLSDFSYAGYGGGYATKPEFNNIIDVIASGVIPNDGLSDVVAINNIIATAPDNSIVFFPAGRYVLDDWIKINRSNIILRGAGDGTVGTVFYMPRSATEINGGTAEAGYNTGGAGQIIEFKGNGSLITITEVSEMALRTDKIIEVVNASNLNQGDIIVINARGDNPTNGELWHAYFNYQSQDWPEPHVSWATGNNVFMTHTIERIEGNLVTLREPLRLDLKPSWGMKVRKLNGALKNVAIEDVRFEFIEKAPANHLQEQGYNAVQFENCQNFWSKNLTIQHCDNGVNIRTSSYGEIEDVTMIGRRGHHGFDIAHSSNNIISNVTFNNTDFFFHGITVNHKANGNVIRNVKGTQLVRLDFHRNVPFSTLWTDIRGIWNHNSSGDPKAGPHAGAWNVYWGLSGESTALYSGNFSDWKEHWGIYTGTIVSGLDSNTPEQFTEEREWYENIPYQDLAEKDLYKLQKEYRANYTPVLEFASHEFGNRSLWKERDYSRWKVQDNSGETYYSLIEDELPAHSSGKLSEYTVTDISSSTVYEIETIVRTTEGLEASTEAEIALVTSYIDDNNYLFARISTNSEYTGIYSVKNGVTAKLVGSTLVLQKDAPVLLKLGVENNDIIFTANNGIVSQTTYEGTMPFGKVGVGSSKTGILFQEFKINDIITSKTDDSDNDGVPNSLDLCPATVANATVNDQGCAAIQLASNNFTISTTGETCVDKKNGILEITANEFGNYIIDFNGNDYDFTTNKTFEGLSAGTYSLCISTLGGGFEQCYEVTIEGGVNLSGKISVTKQSGKVSVVKGTAPYTVTKNGNVLFETYKTEFSVDINHGDELEVSTSKDCEGKMSKRFNLFEDIKAYPNPSNGRFKIYVPNNLDTIQIEIYDVQAQLLSSKKYDVQSGQVGIDIEDHFSGIYFLKLIGQEPVFVKVIKK
tara:strand:+ start:19443 stop:22349 length:2907 start_codon:yes stop_codon:yes gene_type:complete